MLFNWKHWLPLCSVNRGSVKLRAKRAVCCLLFNFPSNCQHNKYETHSALNIWTFAQWKLYIILCQKVCCQTLKSLAQAIAKFMCSISSTFASIVMQSCCKHTHSYKHRQLYSSVKIKFIFTFPLMWPLRFIDDVENRRLISIWIAIKRMHKLWENVENFI